MSEWHWKKNNELGLNPKELTYGSCKKVWWICNKGHEWEMMVNKRTKRSQGCPYCSGRRVIAGINDFETIYPKLAKTWHPTKNGDLTPRDVKYGSSREAWWICEKGHEWKTVISKRGEGSNCPYCSNQRVLAGYNDLATTNPELIKEWNYDKNTKFSPKDFTSGSGIKVWWICDKGHEWEATINGRKKNNCPYCSNHKVLTGYNDLTTTNPKLAKEWNYDKNGSLTPENVTCNSNKKVWWICESGHEYEAKISNRSNGSNCPYCSNQKVLVGYNDLTTTNPKLIREWNYDKNIEFSPEDFTSGSGNKVWWICEKGHEWKASIDSRSKGHGCPYCSGRNVVTGINDLATVNPNLAKEWNYNRNKDLTPQNVACGSNKKVWWQCRKGHEWRAAISSRNKGVGCPHCNKEKQTSFPEQAIFFYCKKFTNAINRYTDLGKEIDIYLPEYNIGIEYNGSHWHKDKEETDKEKVKYFYDKGIRIITVRDGDLNSIEGDVICHNYNDKESLNFVITAISNLINVKIDKPDIISDTNKILEQYIESKKENSIAVKRKKSLVEWNYEKNGKLLPTMVPYGSNKKVWWKCAECNHEWKSIVSSYSKGYGCPICARKTIGVAHRKAVHCIETQMYYNSVKQAEKETGIGKSHIAMVCRGDSDTAGGYHWEYVDEESRMKAEIKRKDRINSHIKQEKKVRCI